MNFFGKRYSLGEKRRGVLRTRIVYPNNLKP